VILPGQGSARIAPSLPWAGKAASARCERGPDFEDMLIMGFGGRGIGSRDGLVSDVELITSMAGGEIDWSAPTKDASDNN
jgi:hypothetical protein